MSKYIDEIWKPVVDYEGLYEVSNYGRLRSLDRIAKNGRRLYGQLINVTTKSTKNASVSLYKNSKSKNFTLHTLVIDSFLGLSNVEIVHIDGDKSNNALNNLKVVNDFEDCSEIWKSVSGFDGIYEISNKGRLRSYLKGNKELSNFPKLRKWKVDKDGYIEYALAKKGKLIHRRAHRLVAQEFIPNSNSYPQVNHINGIKDDNRVENLEWVNQSQNSKHAYEIGLSENSRWMAKMTHGKKCKLISLSDEKTIHFNSLAEVDEFLDKCKGFTNRNYKNNIDSKIKDLGYRFELGGS